jgi:hypothetical protein
VKTLISRMKIVIEKVEKIECARRSAELLKFASRGIRNCIEFVLNGRSKTLKSRSFNPPQSLAVWLLLSEN